MAFDQCIMASILHYSLIQNSFTVLNMPYLSTVIKSYQVALEVLRKYKRHELVFEGHVLVSELKLTSSKRSQSNLSTELKKIISPAESLINNHLKKRKHVTKLLNSTNEEVWLYILLFQKLPKRAKVVRRWGDISYLWSRRKVSEGLLCAGEWLLLFHFTSGPFWVIRLFCRAAKGSSKRLPGVTQL